MELSIRIRDYYLKHFSELPFDKQFHFASRLAAWEDNRACHTHLEAMKEQLLPAGKEAQDILADLLYNPPAAKINAAETREPYFRKYPELRGLMLALFRTRHLLHIYDIDVRPALLELKPYDALHELAVQLARDDDAIRILSTYAINYLFLVEHILFDRATDTIDIDKIYELGDAYDQKDPEDVLLLIYLYTHCIIGEVNFYQRAVSEHRRPSYIRMLQRIEHLISENFDSINLDNKLEFLVSARICGYDAPALASRIYAECEQSLSAEGDFLVDTLNSAPQSNKTSFADSEHRNVLFIMSTSAYSK